MFTPDSLFLVLIIIIIIIIIWKIHFYSYPGIIYLVTVNLPLPFNVLLCFTHLCHFLREIL
ncbi:MAG: hypothetical protein N7Q72_05080, partial [Spiroplasma sp. Tabriz.8]|nr:hypothetical protein [Spiroplasma sp. Tabriz.8]